MWNIILSNGHGSDITYRERESVQRLKGACGGHRRYHRFGLF